MLLGLHKCRFPPPLAGGEGVDALEGPGPGETDTCAKTERTGRRPNVCGAGARVTRTSCGRSGPPPENRHVQLAELEVFIMLMKRVKGLTP